MKQNLLLNRLFYYNKRFRSQLIGVLASITFQSFELMKRPSEVDYEMPISQWNRASTLTCVLLERQPFVEYRVGLKTSDKNNRKDKKIKNKNHGNRRIRRVIF